MNAKSINRKVWIALIAGFVVLSLWMCSTGTAHAAVNPGKVTSVSLTVTGQPVAKLKWKQATGAANGYTVIRDGKAIVRITGKNVLSYTDESLKQGKSYTYTIKPHYKAKTGKITYGKAAPAKKILNGYTYKKESDGSMTLTGYTGRDSLLTTPASIDGGRVKTIGNSCFRGNVWIGKVRVSEGVTRIDDYAFEACSMMKSSTLPSTLRTIGDGAFSGCGQMRYCDMPDSVTSIGNGAFLYCGRLGYVDLPKNLKTMGKFTFAGCGKLGDVAFNGNDLTVIPDRAFCQCSNLKDINIPASVVSIGKRAFSGCGSLETVEFQGNKALSIGDYAFERCYAIQFSFLQFQEFDGRLSFGFGAFSEVNAEGSERYFELPYDTTFREGAFFDSNIKGIINMGAYEDNVGFSNHVLEDGVLYSADKKTLIAYFPLKDTYDEWYLEMGLSESAKSGEFSVPEGVERIAPYAFCNSPLKKVTLSSTVKKVDNNAFTMSGVAPDMLDTSQCSGVVIDEDAFVDNGAEQFDEYSGKGLAKKGKGEREENELVWAESLDIRSLAGNGIFNKEKFRDYLDIHEGFEGWCKKYIEYNKNNMPVTREAMPYITMYTGNDHYPQMISVLNGDAYKTQQSIRKSGDDYREMYLMIDHGLFAELSRGRMPGNLLLYSGITPEKVSHLAGAEIKTSGAITEELRNMIIARIGGYYTDNAIMSSTADVYTSFIFSAGDYGSQTIVMIYASKAALDSLGTICVADISDFSSEEEILFNTEARYRIMDVGLITHEINWIDAVTGDIIRSEDTDQRTYVKLELLGGPEGSPENVSTKVNPMTVRGKIVKVKRSKLKKKKVKLKVSKVIKVRNAKGKVSYRKISGKKKITINKKTGKVTIKKGMKKGKYRVKVKVKAAGNEDYYALTKTATFVVKVK